RGGRRPGTLVTPPCAACASRLFRGALAGGREFAAGLLHRGGRVFLHVLAGGEHQLDRFHLHLLRHFGEGGQGLGGRFGLGRGEVRQRLRIVRRLVLDGGDGAELVQRPERPLRRDLGRLLGGV